MVGASASARQERAMTREPSSGSTSAASSKSENLTTVLGTRCFSGLTGKPRLYALLRALSLPRRLIVNHVRGRKSNRVLPSAGVIPRRRDASGILAGRGVLLGQGLVLEPCF